MDEEPILQYYEAVIIWDWIVHCEVGTQHTKFLLLGEHINARISIAGCKLSHGHLAHLSGWRCIHMLPLQLQKPNPSTFFLFNLYQHAHVSETRRGSIFGIPHGVQTELATFVSDSLKFSRLWNEVLDSTDQRFWEEKEVKVRGFNLYHGVRSPCCCSLFCALGCFWWA